MKPDGGNGKTRNVRRKRKPCIKRGRSWNRKKKPLISALEKKETGDVPASTEITRDGMTGGCALLMEVYKFTEAVPEIHGGREVT